MLARRLHRSIVAIAMLGLVLVGQRGWAIASVGPVRARSQCRCCPARPAPSEPALTARCCSVDAPAPGLPGAPPTAIDAAPLAVLPATVAMVRAVAAPAWQAPRGEVAVRAIGPPRWLVNCSLRR